MATDITGNLRLKCDFATRKKGWSEVYNLVASDFTAGVKAGKAIASWRAAILGQTATLKYAVVSTLGKPPLSKICIDSPIPGGSGVKFIPQDDFKLKDLYVNTAASGLRFRLETASGEFNVRGFRAFPDVTIKREEYTMGVTDPEVPELGTYDAVVDFDTFALPIESVWNPATVYTDPEKAAFASWEVALQNFLKVLFAGTCHWAITGTGDSRSVTKTGWLKLAYRGVTDRKSGRPSLA